MKDLFAAMRQEDERQAPDFEQVWDEAVARAAPPRRTIRLARYAAAAVVLVGLGMAAFLLSRPPSDFRLRGADITEWTSPTASLLNAPIMQPVAWQPPTTSLLSPPLPYRSVPLLDTRTLRPGNIIQPDTTH
ncbi:MAG: hypothetical protein ACE5G0_06055 [Rhodothermales bacterium]